MTQFSDLLDGYSRFRAAGWHEQRDRWAVLKDGQQPRVMVITCSDSRVDPAQIFDTFPGEIFVVRNVAALVPPFETGGGYHGVSAALEFAVTQLKVAEIVVMGHEKCGGAKAALTRAFSHAAPGQGGFIANWVHMLDDARDRIDAGGQTGEAAERAMEHEAVRTSLQNLLTFPFVRDAIDDDALTIHGAYFSIADGTLHVLDAADAFTPAPITLPEAMNDY